MKVVKTISFNPSSPYEERILLYLGNQGAFATYVKRLIFADYEGRRAPAVVPVEAVTVRVGTQTLRPSFVPENTPDEGNAFAGII